MASFVGELEAFKPGNVSRYADGHDMTYQDFLTSAEVSVPLLCQADRGVGQRILESVKATREAVGCNTNLGMLLLFAPIIAAAESGFKSENDLHSQLGIILNSLTQEDAELVFEAIRIANPGGLGDVEAHDVKQQKPGCSLIEAMTVASSRDSVALQYSTGFHDVFELGLTNIKCFVKLWNSVKWAAVSCYMTYMSSIRDSHIQRKYGQEIAEQIRIKSGVVAKKFKNSIDPESCIGLLGDFDEELKAKNYNPGTSADLTAATLLVYNLTFNK